MPFRNAWGAPPGGSRHDSGQIAIITALVAPVAAVMTAFVIDLGSMSTQKRELQGLVDMAAIAAASKLETPEAAARLVLSDNGYAGIGGELDEELERATGGANIRVETGRFSFDPDVPHDDRFQSGVTPYNAARVYLAASPERYFDFIGGKRKSLDVSGTAVISTEAAISVGSRLASLDGGFLNAMLSELTGAEISLSAMSYDALLDANVDLMDSLDWLADDLQLSALTYNELLALDVPFASFVEAMAETTTGGPLASQSLRTISQENDLAELSIELNTLIDLGRAERLPLGKRPPGAAIELKALNLLTASAVAANGEQQLDLDLSAGVPGLVALTATLDLGERPQGTSWFSLTGPYGQTVTTAQLRLNIEASIGGGELLSFATVRLPIQIDLASAEATIAEIDCAPGEALPRRVRVDVKPSIARLRISEPSSSGEATSSPATLVRTRLLKVSAFADVNAGNRNEERLYFARHEIGGDP